MTDKSTGHVLFIEFCQEFIKGWVERTLINPELVKHGFKEGDVFISFMTGDADLDTNYLETDDEGKVDSATAAGNKDGSTALTTDPNPYETQKRKNGDE